ncbi:MAG: hypothetical protein KKC20_01195 [Proteobacteria bacterium]|nr:hypothetical protein [Pseudomonadota bacterium]
MSNNLRHIKNRIRCNRGQSTVEYVVVTSALLAALMAAPSVSDTLVQTFYNKYESYSFGIAISDPPREETDKKVHEITETIDKWIQQFDDFELPDKLMENIPGTETIKLFLKKLTDYF